jgi:hypothetical protein
LDCTYSFDIFRNESQTYTQQRAGTNLDLYRNTQHQLVWNKSNSVSSKHQRSSSKKEKKSKKRDKKKEREGSNEEPVTPEHQVLLQVSPDESPCVQDVDARDLLFVSIKRTSRRQSHSSLKKSEPAMKRNSLDDISYENGHKSPFQISVFRCIEELNNRSSETYSELKFTPFDPLSEDEAKVENRMDSPPDEKDDGDQKQKDDGDQKQKDDDKQKEKDSEKKQAKNKQQKPGILFSREFEIRCQHVWSKAITCVYDKST